MCLTMWKTSPVCYRVLRDQLKYIPSETTLRRLQRKAKLRPGKNSALYKCLKEKAKTVFSDKKDRALDIVFDEMNVNPHLDVDPDGNITGVEDWGVRDISNDDETFQQSTRTFKYADHVIIVLIRSLYTGKKLVLDYGFCQSQTLYKNLAEIICGIVQSLEDCGYTLHALICDQSKTNCKLIKHLLELAHAAAAASEDVAPEDLGPVDYNSKLFYIVTFYYFR